ncbi:hypothetical protein [Nocardia huaxiensis]|uniref:Uncharacterized protein n=1 Tax=Nocardia huaxiensis TaxID=2755382 RepID=A0A7D6V8Q5_9NOCA|nr:hypothetical protein [Nocardia huaxiensis]QLY28382.1 hypothetical protein H0264_23755 [Nocardia huaxiensis]UFS98166.1 hypothetical protein LPY97_09850 [Nocardia huaxiensis]
MTIEFSTRAMTSDITPEYAVRAHGYGEPVWRLTWLPEHRLTREQAHAGMELDEILSDPTIVYDDDAHSRAADRAARLGILVEHAVIMLAQRMADRMDRDGTASGSDSGPEWPEPSQPEWPVAQQTPAISGARSQHLWA